MSKIRCVLIDDELPGLTYLKMLCEQISDLEVVKAFKSPVTFLEEMDFLDFDLCIIDIEMPGMNGLQVVNLLKGKPVIFTTAYNEYAAEAFDLDAVDYIRKPLKMERLQQAIEKAKNKINNEKKEKTFFQLNSDKGKVIVFFEQLSYVRTSEVDSRDKIATLIDGTEIVLKNISFQKMLQLLPDNQFIQINRKEIIAIKAIRAFSFDEIVTNITNIQNGQQLILTLSEIYRNQFLKYVEN